jgi:hypothetical protein
VDVGGFVAGGEAARARTRLVRKVWNALEVQHMGYDVQQELGEHDVSVDTVDLIESGAELIVRVRVKFKDNEIGNKDLYPLKSEKSAQICRKSLSAIGFSMDTRDLGELQQNPSLLKGNPCRVVVEENDYKGNVTNRISWINAIPKAAGKSLLEKAQAKLRNVKTANTEESL